MFNRNDEDGHTISNLGNVFDVSQLNIMFTVQHFGGRYQLLSDSWFAETEC